MARTAWFLVVITVTGGCVSPDLGALYNDDVDGAVVEGGSKAIIYVDDTIDSGIAYSIFIDGEESGRLFPGTFIQATVDPGRHILTARERWTGKGFGKGLGESIIKPFSGPANPYPEQLSLGDTTLEISMVPADVAYVRITKPREGVEVFYECEGTKDTTTMCQHERFPTELQIVSVADAREELQTFKESL